MFLQALFARGTRKKNSLRSGKRSGRVFECLELRNLLAADLAITSFGADGTSLVIDYEIAGQTAGDFNIAIYRSFDGVSLDQCLVSKQIDLGLGVGSYQVCIAADFSDELLDYQLIAVIAADGDYEVSNNQMTFGGGVFVDANSNVQVHGTADADFITISQDDFFHVSFNGITFDYVNYEVSGITIRSHAGDDLIFVDYAYSGSVVAFGGADNDVFLGGAGDDLFFGGSGADMLFGGAGNDSLWGEDGDDFLSGDEGDDHLDGGAGANTLYGGDGSDTLGSENSDYYGYGDILDGGEGDDIIYGTSGDDIIYGGAGNDTIYGLGGNDQLFGEDGDDILDGGDGDDYLYGGAGSDTLYGGAGYDSLFGEEGDDYLYGGSEDDYLVGGNGHDLHDTGGDASDVIGDRPKFSNFAYSYSAILNAINVAGVIIDDESCANLFVNYSGVAQGAFGVNEAGAFFGSIAVSHGMRGWLVFNFTDSEGLEAESMSIYVT